MARILCCCLAIGALLTTCISSDVLARGGFRGGVGGFRGGYGGFRGGYGGYRGYSAYRGVGGYRGYSAYRGVGGGYHGAVGGFHGVGGYHGAVGGRAVVGPRGNVATARGAVVSGPRGRTYGTVNRSFSGNRGTVSANRSFNSNRYASWHHGSWNGSWYGNHGWYGRYGYGRYGYWNRFANRAWYANSAFWGLYPWALGSIYYNSGYGYGVGGGYYNPYYVQSSAPAAVASDYSAPLQTSYASPTDSDEPPPALKAADDSARVARVAFQNDDYALALKEIDKALQRAPNDAAIHELRALVYFAQGNYTQAASTLYAVLSAGPGWNWTTLSGMYPSIAKYEAQLRALEQFVKLNPNSPEGHFVLAYQFMTANHKDEAIRELKEVLRLQPKDQLTAQLLKMVEGPGPQDKTAASKPPEDAADPYTIPDDPSLPDLDPAKLVGDWTAFRKSDGTKFTLKLTADSQFTWSFERDGKRQQFGGKYKVEGAVLELDRSNGGVMPGLVVFTGDTFNFKLHGGLPDDPGLDFHQ